MLNFKNYISEATIKQELPKNSKILDPALLTFEEYYKIANPQKKHHSSDSYDWDLKDMNNGVYKAEEYTKLINNYKIKGINFELRAKLINNYTDNKYVKYVNDEIERIDGEIQYYTAEELEKLGKTKYSYEFIIIEKENNKVVAISSDEWGAILIVVAREYRGFGLGTIISKITRKYQPAKSSGGFTNEGYNTFIKIHTEFVKDYLKSGKYNELIKSGMITSKRVKEIVLSARLDLSKTKSKVSFDKDKNNKYKIDPSNWLLFSENEEFIIYDKRLKDVWNDDKIDDYWKERFFIGMIYTSEGQGTYKGEHNIHYFGAINDKVKQTLLMLQLSLCKNYNEVLRLHKDLIHLLDSSKVNIKKSTRERDEYVVSLKKNPINYEHMIKEEQKFRKTFDKYDEFKIFMMETSYKIYDE